MTQLAAPIPLRCLLLALLLLVASCASRPPLEESTAWSVRQAQLESLDHWQLQGRVNARYENESHTPRIRWLQDAERYTIRLWGTLNAGATLIEGSPGFVTFKQDGQVHTASSPETLILEHLGYELPVSRLNYWIKGLPTPDAEHRLELGEFNEPVSLVQSGWTVRYLDYRLFGTHSLPRRVEMRREQNDISLVFIGLNWIIDGPTD